ncbi:MAG: AraC family transcriptional regulator [Azospirillaceae bacterium]|nr:AraC family transcriptional regulator [Azospirillaceae bacterium]
MTTGRGMALSDALTPAPRPLLPRRAEMSVVRMRRDQDEPISLERLPIPSLDAFSVIVQLRDFARHELWRGGKLVHAGGHARTALAVTHLGEDWACRHLSAFDNVRVQIPRAVLDGVTQDLGRPRVGGFTCPAGTLDPVVYNLACALLPALDMPNGGGRLFVDQVTLALAVHVAQAYGGMTAAFPLRTGGLSAWQEARAKEFLAANLGGDIGIAQVAAECGLSRGYFIKAFRQTTGLTPYRWLMERRVAGAKDLLRGPLPIADIALSCGFADQSHLTRVFTTMTGLPPGAWRRRFR